MTHARDAAIAPALTRWFTQAARDLPWRHNRDGYTALVSEAMLQQTQVSRVVDKYIAFMQRFPTVQSLATAEEQEVLAAWQGLGYYRRARNLHAAARMIIHDFSGRVPRDVDDLLKLPGVGRYTAGAIASIIHDRPVPIVDGNVHRVLARLDATPDLSVRSAWPRADRLVAGAKQPGRFNEGMMELGATICTPRLPKCSVCPLRRHCEAFRRDIQDKCPRVKDAVTKREVHHHAVIVLRGQHCLFEQRPSQGLWSNMWQVPTVEATTKLSSTQVVDRLELKTTVPQSLEAFRHITTHRRITFHVFTARTRMRRGVWRACDDIADLPMSNAQQKIVARARELTLSRT